MKHFFDGFFTTYQNGVFIYCCAIYAIYATLTLFSYLSILANIQKNCLREKLVLIQSSLSPGISIITGAFNEERTIIPNVRSLLTMNYPLFEVIVVNDGSTDNTLEKLRAEFGLVEVKFAYHYFIQCNTVLRVFKSSDPAFSNLLVIDKLNGGNKADAINAGINASSYNYFLNTDVDCILDKDTLVHLIQPFIDDEKKVIATGATLRMVNSCVVDAGVLIEPRIPKEILPRFQEIEYIRSFVIGKMGWNLVNCIPNVSGGLGMFDKDIVIKVGGYDRHSFGEDMDMLMRMSKYMCEQKIDYAIRYIPQSLCWTEGPSSLKVFRRQRLRWGRGLYQIFSSYYRLLFNPRYGSLGMVVLPYNFIFELCAPIIEFLGIVCYLYLIFSGLINWPYAIILLLFVYFFSIFITLLSIVWDQLVIRRYRLREVIRLCFWAFLEPLLYHPLVMIFALAGYVRQFFKIHTHWGHMERRGFGETTGPEMESLNSSAL
ncbi:MAG: glycosyltransferase family 2 protein [Chitinophagaceae bacterium]|nr:glycosyltransferase family 2 protein [Chitinophagaceae bacterium]